MRRRTVDEPLTLVAGVEEHTQPGGGGGGTCYKSQRPLTGSTVRLRLYLYGLCENNADSFRSSLLVSSRQDTLPRTFPCRLDAGEKINTNCEMLEPFDVPPAQQQNFPVTTSAVGRNRVRPADATVVPSFVLRYLVVKPQGARPFGYSCT
ncbi:unnamed protein product [Nezara viridula]|uniref:Uncharacterized protein n=1 Tax=Nezara viridula TaxID=85310 RepID=A0A9P0H4Z9_NEZVI|nr:unnamed protein product [Nezara viridula]